MPSIMSASKPANFTNTFLSVLAWTVMAVVTAFYFTLGLLVAAPLSFLLEKGNGRLVHGVSRLWARTLIFLSPVWKLDVRGVENIPKGKTCVIVANHQSLLDILAALAGVPVHFKFMAKKELFPIPFLGWHMSLAGYIPLERGSKESAKQAVALARGKLQQGVSVLLFPEGTRSPDGSIQEFKAGAFKIAAEENVLLLPVVIDGTAAAIPKHSWVLRGRTRFRVSILPPVSLAGGDAAAMENTRQSVRGRMIAELDALRGRQGPSLRLLSLNTWQERGPWQDRWEVILDGARKFRPDVMALQEVFNNTWAEEVRKKTGMHSLAAFSDSSGLVLLSRFPFAEKEIRRFTTQSPTENYYRYAVYARIETPQGPLAFLNTHLSYRPEQSDVRQGQVDELLAFIEEKQAGLPVVITGDFNATPETPEIRRITAAGFTDAYEEKHGGEQGWTWCHGNPYTQTEPNRVDGDLLPERRIDYVFYRPAGGVPSALDSCEIIFNEPSARGIWASDHFGLLTAFRLRTVPES